MLLNPGYISHNSGYNIVVAGGLGHGSIFADLVVIKIVCHLFYLADAHPTQIRRVRTGQN